MMVLEEINVHAYSFSSENNVLYSYLLHNTVELLITDLSISEPRVNRQFFPLISSLSSVLSLKIVRDTTLTAAWISIAANDVITICNFLST